MKKCIKNFVTCEQMKVLERRADADGLSYYQMMENAGTGAAALIMERHAYAEIIGPASIDEGNAAGKVAEGNAVPLAEAANAAENAGKPPDRDADPSGRTSKGRVYVFCGKGNNGGDGFVAARCMCEAGYEVTVILVDGEPKTEDSITNLGLLRKLPVRILDMHSDDRALMELRGTPDIIVDAIYGTGFRGRLKSNGLKAAIYINRYSKGDPDVISDKQTMVAALDIPSGIGGDLTNEKELDHSSVTAHYTITFHARKPVHLQAFAEKLCGEVLVVDIGIDAERLWHVDKEL